MSKDVAHEVSQIVREAATNVRRHAKATTLTCNIEEHQGTLRIDVIDDGIGFQMKRKPVGLGMLGMHERAHLIGATLAIQSEPERGSVVRLIIPPYRFEVVSGQIA
jgi:signal transduction histidine kinase